MKKLAIAIVLFLTVGFIGGFFYLSKKIDDAPEINQILLDDTTGKIMASDAVIGNVIGIDYEVLNIKGTLYKEDLKLRLKIKATRNGITGIIDVSVNGYVEYRNKGLYFIIDEKYPPKFHDISFTGKLDEKSERSLEKVKKWKDSIFKKDKKELKSESTFGRLMNKIPKEKFAPVIEEVARETVTNIKNDPELLDELRRKFKEAAVKIIAKAFRTIPVYKLGNSIPENAVAVAIKSVKIEDYIVKIEISLWDLAWYLIMMLIFGLVCLGILFMAAVNPKAFEGLALLGTLSM